MVGSKLIIGSRGSKLALAQATWVKERLEHLRPELQLEIAVIKTSGDLFSEAPLSQIGGKGLFTKEIEEALLGSKIDLAVHSLKDLPTVLPNGLCLAAVSEREDARDGFVSNKWRSLDELPQGAVVGTSSLRRHSQLMRIRSDLEIRNLRGNLDTRLRKLDEGSYDAIILACAGLIRLGLAHRITKKISTSQICPAIGQGALGIETRAGDTSVINAIQSLNHIETELATQAERAFLRRLGGGCQVPIAAFGRVEGRELHLEGVVASIDGKQIYRHSVHSVLNEAETLGIGLAESLLAMGAGQVLERQDARQ
jgi:hydroxymethylbilane synthase